MDKTYGRNPEEDVAMARAGREQAALEERYSKIKSRLTEDIIIMLDQHIGPLRNGMRIDEAWVRSAEREIENGYGKLQK